MIEHRHVLHFSSHNTGEKYQINYFDLTIYRDPLFIQKSKCVMHQHISSCIAILPVKRRQATSQTNSQCNQDSSSMYMCHYNRMHHKKWGLVEMSLEWYMRHLAIPTWPKFSIPVYPFSTKPKRNRMHHITIKCCGFYRENWIVWSFICLASLFNVVLKY